MEDEKVEVYEGEVVDMVPTEESGDNKTGNGLAFVIGAAATCAGMFLYKKVVTPLVRKHKAKKEKEKQDSGNHEYLNVSSDDVNEFNDD